MEFGKESDRGVRLNGVTPEVVQLADGVSESDLLVHDEKAESATLAYLLSQLEYPQFPVPLGVYRARERATYDALLEDQVRSERERDGAGDLEKLLNSGDTWEV